jgi:trigger factor
MQVTETQTAGLKREYKVVLAAKDIDQKLEARLQQIGQQAKIPGFRPGKVPITVLKQRFGQSVMGEVLQQAVQDSSSQAIAERGLRPAMQPKIEITSFDKGKDLEYTLAVELMPEVKVMDLGKIALERVQVEAPDSEVEEALGRLAGAYKTTEPLEKPRPAASGDVLVIDFQGTVDGEALPGMAANDHHLELGSSQFIDTFEEQLVGAAKGDHRELKVTFPKEYGNDKLAGREAIFQVDVKDILAAVPAALDDDLAKRLGEESLTTLRQRVREQIEKDYARITRGRLKRDILDQLAKGHDFEVPPGMVDAEFDMIWRQVEEDRKGGQLDPEDEGKSDDELKGEYREIAERRVRLGLLLSEIGRQNSIEVSQEEVNQALLREAQRHPGQEREVFEFFQRSPEALANLRAPLFEDKVIDFIADLAAVTERKISPDQLREEIEAGNEAGNEAGDDSKPAKKAKPKKAGKKAAAKTSGAAPGGEAAAAERTEGSDS